MDENLFEAIKVTKKQLPQKIKYKNFPLVLK